MKQLLTITLLVFSIITTAQNTATPAKIEGKDIYVLLVNTNPTDFVESVNLSKEQATSATDFNTRIQLLISLASTQDYDAITTRDGKSVQLIKYKDNKNITKANVPNYFGKEVYFLSNPTKKYKVVETKEITKEDAKNVFYNVASTYAKNDNVTFDAVIISNKQVKYIQYNK